MAELPPGLYARRDPVLHTHADDGLPWNHPWSQEDLSCQLCRTMVHVGHNECMTQWVETAEGPYCLPCYVVRTVSDTVDALALPGLPADTQPDPRISPWLYRRTSPTVQAMRYDPTLLDEIWNWVGRDRMGKQSVDCFATVQTPSGTARLAEGDWVMRVDIDGQTQWHVVPADDFERDWRPLTVAEINETLGR